MSKYVQQKRRSQLRRNEFLKQNGDACAPPNQDSQAYDEGSIPFTRSSDINDLGFSVRKARCPYGKCTENSCGDTADVRGTSTAAYGRKTTVCFSAAKVQKRTSNTTQTSSQSDPRRTYDDAYCLRSLRATRVVRYQTITCVLTCHCAASCARPIPVQAQLARPRPQPCPRPSP